MEVRFPAAKKRPFGRNNRKKEVKDWASPRTRVTHGIETRRNLFGCIEVQSYGQSP